LALPAALLSVALLGGCGNFLADHTPQVLGGMPSDAPPRPADAPAYPSLGATPPQRETTPLSYDQQQTLENDLIAVRNRTCAAGPTPTGGTAGASTANSTAPACNSAAAASPKP
jgi:hypothetical protein